MFISTDVVINDYNSNSMNTSRNFVFSNSTESDVRTACGFNVRLYKAQLKMPVSSVRLYTTVTNEFRAFCVAAGALLMQLISSSHFRSTTFYPKAISAFEVDGPTTGRNDITTRSNIFDNDFSFIANSGFVILNSKCNDFSF